MGILTKKATDHKLLAMRSRKAGEETSSEVGSPGNLENGVL